MQITQELVKELFEYRDGDLYWKIRASQRVRAGDKAGKVEKRGYRAVSIKRKYYKVHRIIFLMFHGYLPLLVDHIDGNKLNNDINNLRPATHAQNCQNAKISKTNTSGYKGVTWDKENKKWMVQIHANGKNKKIGRFDDLELAGLVAAEARNKYHKEFANHGKVKQCN